MIRLRCVVPFCRHTRGDRKGQPPITPDTEWICGEHWRLVDRQTKRLFRANRRRLWRIPGRQLRGPEAQERVHRRLWQTMKRQAIERAL